MGTPVLTGDAVLVQSTTPGTGTLQLGPALDGFFSFAAAGIASGARVSYVVLDSLTNPTRREVGEGVYTAGSPGTLTRASIKRSTSSNAAISWDVGTRYIFLAPHAGVTAMLDTEGRLPASLLPAEFPAPSQAASPARRDTVAWESIGVPDVGGAVSAVAFSWDASTWRRVRVRYHDLSPAAAAALYLRLSTDGGASFRSGSSDYGGVRMDGTASGLSSVAAGGSYAQLSASTANALLGEVEIPVTSQPIMAFRSHGFTTAPSPILSQGTCHTNFGVTPNALLLGFVGTTISGRNVTLEGQR